MVDGDAYIHPIAYAFISVYCNIGVICTYYIYATIVYAHIRYGCVFILIINSMKSVTLR